MRRLLPVLLALSAASGAVAASSACSSTTETIGPGGSQDAGADQKVVSVDDGGGPLPDGGLAPSPPSCDRYCDLLSESCTGEHLQYASDEACLAFCAHLPEGKAGEIGAATLACRQYYAGNPSRTDPAQHCRAAGPFGGDNACGSRCKAFCDVALSACGSVANPPYATQPDCQSACTGYVFLDPTVDGGGEGPTGPSTGDTLNCRLYWLREAVMDAGACSAIRQQSDTCK